MDGREPQRSTVSGHTWTPAPRPGLIPLHPMTFGTVIGRSFAALRHNPKVLFGFAIVVQLVVLLASAAVMTVVLLSSVNRLETVRPGSSEFESIVAGSAGIGILAGIGIGLGSIAFTALVQGVVAADIAGAVVGDRSSLRQLWRRVRPVFWRLLGFALLSMIVMVIIMIVFAVVAFGGLFAFGGADSDAGVGMMILLLFLAVLALVPLIVWLNTKLLLVPSVLVIEGATLRQALLRSWRLTRRRFWFTFGVAFVIGLIMNIAAQVVSVPTGAVSGLLIGIISPTGELDDGQVTAFLLSILLPQVLILVIQAVATVVQTTGAALVYIDSRMRYEGLDQTLLSYVERRQGGVTAELLPDPFALDPARAVGRTPPPPRPAYAPPVPPTAYVAPAPGQYAVPPQYAGTQYDAPPYGAPPYAAPQYPTAPHQVPPYAAAPQPPAAPQAPRPVATPMPPTDSPWATPGDSPWAAPGGDRG